MKVVRRIVWGKWRKKLKPLSLPFQKDMNTMVGLGESGFNTRLT
jgi:hypothetical protein